MKHEPKLTALPDARLSRIARLDRLSRLLDTAFRVPGTRLRIGLDSIVGLLPGVGDAVSLVPAAYIVGSAWHMGAPGSVILRMALNSGLDFAVGSVPVLGDIFDAGFKANRRNVSLLRDWAMREGIAVPGNENGPPYADGPAFNAVRAAQPTSSRPEKK